MFRLNRIKKGEIPAISESAESKPSSDKWQKTKDYLGRERISMKTPQGGMVSIYETDNSNQKNNRFRVDTGTHADYFNSMEEAKAFAEEHYGPKSKPDKVGDFMNAYERGDFGKYQQNAEQRKAESFFKQNRDAAPRKLTGDCKIRIRK